MAVMNLIPKQINFGNFKHRRENMVHSILYSKTQKLTPFEILRQIENTYASFSCSYTYVTFVFKFPKWFLTAHILKFCQLCIFYKKLRSTQKSEVESICIQVYKFSHMQIDISISSETDKIDDFTPDLLHCVLL